MTSGTATGRAVVVRSLADAEAAAAAAAELQVPVTLLSCENATGTVGPLWFLALVEQTRSAYPQAQISAVLDCGDQPGSATAALRLGFRRIRFAGRGRAAEAVAAIAAEFGAELLARRPEALELTDSPDPRRAAEAWLRDGSG